MAKIQLFCYSVILLLLFSCSTRRQSRSQIRTEMYEEVVKKDTTHILRLMQQFKNRQTEIRYVEFSDPDTLGKQFIRLIGDIRVNEQIDWADSLIIENNVITNMQLKRNDERIVSESVPFKRKWKWIIYLFIGICAICYIYVRIRNKSG